MVEFLQQAPAVLIGTFNLSQRPIEQDLSDWLATHPSLSNIAPESSPAVSAAPVFSDPSAAAASTPIMPDIVVIALQEFVPYPDAFIHDTYQIKPKIDSLAQLILRTLHRTCPGHRFSLVSQTAQVGMTLLVLTRDGSMTEYVERILNASVGTGPLGMGNKGAIATRLSIRLPATANNRPCFDICFINAHLSAHLNMIKRRNHDYLNICRRMVFVDDADNHVQGMLFEHQARLSSTSSLDNMRRQQDDDDDSFYQADDGTGPLLPKKNTDNNKKNTKKRHGKEGDEDKKGVWEESIFACDYIFWAGDLNYRLDLSQSDGSVDGSSNNKKKKSKHAEDMLSQSTMPDLTAGEIAHSIKQGQLRQLYSHDQLSAQRKTMNVFKGFREAPLAFPPTYKFQMGTDEYDISKRVPAWTDRVLWHVHPRDSNSAEEEKLDELDAWDEHSQELGPGSLPMAGDLTLLGTTAKFLSRKKSRGTFSSLTKKGGARALINIGTFEPPMTSEPVHDPSLNNGASFYRAPLSSALSSNSVNSLSSRSNGSGGQTQAQAPYSQSPTSTIVSTSSVGGGELCTSPLLIHYYTSHPYYKSSDHKPVSALFTLLPHNLATQMEPSPYGIDPAWRRKKWIGKKLTTIVGHLLRWGFLVLGLGIFSSLFMFVRRYLHGW